METKFIGLEGFNEIESIKTSKKKNVQLNTAQKTVRFIKRASVLIIRTISRKFHCFTAKKTIRKNRQNVIRKKKVSVIDKCYTENRRGNASSQNVSVMKLISDVKPAQVRKYAHSAPISTEKSVHRGIRKKAVLASVSCLTAIMLSCVTVASALDAEKNISSNIASTNVKYSANNIDTTSEFVPEEPEIYYSYSAVATADEVSGITLNKTTFNNVLNEQPAALYVDGELIGITKESEELNTLLDKVLTDYRKDYDAETTTEFANEVKVEPVTQTTDKYFTAKELIDSASDKFSITLSTDMWYNVTLDYETEYEYDDTKDESYREVKTKGCEGEAVVTLRTTFTDGMQTDCVQTDLKVTKEPVNEVVIVGTQVIEEEEESYSYSEDNNATYYSNGSFAWPVPYTSTITSYYGYRWGTTHTGIDISDSGIYGQDIVASDSGTVTWAGYDDSGYGYYVIIDHGNGYQTLYGHCSSLAVSQGETVYQGQTIAYVGSSGDSTGAHLHFEIRSGSNRLDPMTFL